MDIRTVQDVLMLQQELVNKFAQQFEMLHQDRKISVTELLEEKEKELARTQEKIEIVIQERDQIIERWNQRIEQHEASFVRLKAEIAELKAQMAVEKKAS